MSVAWHTERAPWRHLRQLVAGGPEKILWASYDLGSAVQTAAVLQPEGDRNNLQHWAYCPIGGMPCHLGSLYFFI